MVDAADTSPIDAAAFGHFLLAQRKALRRIAGHTRKEHELADVENEAWLMAQQIHKNKGITIDFLDPVDQKLLIAHVYQHLVRYTETQVRHAVRLDHWSGADGDDSPHPLMNKLVSGEGFDPLAQLLRKEEAAQPADDINPRASQAGAYVHLLRHFDNRMDDVASHLLISLSWCYRRCARARSFAERQQQLPTPAAPRNDAFFPETWRRFRQLRSPVQLPLNFSASLGLDV